MQTEAKKKAQTKYLGKCKRINFIISNSDQDMIDYLSKKDNIIGYIKGLIRRDMERCCK